MKRFRQIGTCELHEVEIYLVKGELLYLPYGSTLMYS